MLYELIQSAGEPAVPFPIFVDSPLARNSHRGVSKHPGRNKLMLEAQAFSGKGQDPFGFERLRYLARRHR